jgi:hypothetical protein
LSLEITTVMNVLSIATLSPCVEHGRLGVAGGRRDRDTANLFAKDSRTEKMINQEV